MLEYDESDIFLYGQIGADILGEGITASDFNKAISANKTGQANIYISSPGGDVNEGKAIIANMRRFREKGGTINIHVDSIAASMASGIAMEGDRVIMSDNSMMMIHAPWTLAMGNSDTLRATANILDKYQQTLSMSYQAKSGKTAAEMDEIFEGELWLTAAEAVEEGFADEIKEGSNIKAQVNPDKMGWKETPESLVNREIAAFKSIATESGDMIVDNPCLSARQRILHRLWMQTL